MYFIFNYKTRSLLSVLKFLNRFELQSDEEILTHNRLSFTLNTFESGLDAYHTPRQHYSIPSGGMYDRRRTFFILRDKKYKSGLKKKKNKRKKKKKHGSPTTKYFLGSDISRPSSISSRTPSVGKRTPRIRSGDKFIFQIKKGWRFLIPFG